MSIDEYELQQVREVLEQRIYDLERKFDQELSDHKSRNRATYEDIMDALVEHNARITDLEQATP